MSKAGVVLRATPWVLGGLLASYFFLIFQDVRRMEAVALANRTLSALDEQLQGKQAADAQETVKQARRALEEDYNPLASLRLAVDAWSRQPKVGGFNPQEAQAFKRDVWGALARAWDKNTQLAAVCLKERCASGTIESAYVHRLKDEDAAVVFAGGRLYKLTVDPHPDEGHVDFAMAPIELSLASDGLRYLAYGDGELLLFTRSGEAQQRPVHRLHLDKVGGEGPILEDSGWLMRGPDEIVAFNDQFIVVRESEENGQRIIVRKTANPANPDFAVDVATGAEYGFATITKSHRLIVATYQTLDDAFEYTLSAYDTIGGAWRAASQPPLKFRSGATLAPSQQLGNRSDGIDKAGYEVAWDIIDPSSGMMVIPDRGTDTNTIGNPVLFDFNVMSRTDACRSVELPNYAVGREFAIQGWRLLRSGTLLGIVDREYGELSIFDIRPGAGCRLLDRISIEGEPVAQIFDSEAASLSSPYALLLASRGGAVYRSPEIEIAPPPSVANSVLSASRTSPTIRRRTAWLVGHETPIVSFTFPSPSSVRGRGPTPLIGSAYVSISQDAQLSLWCAVSCSRTLTPVREMETPAAIGAPAYARVVDDGDELVAVVGERGAALIGLDDQSLKAMLEVTGAGLTGLEPGTANFSPRARYFYAPGGEPGEVRVWDLRGDDGPREAIFRFKAEERPAPEDQILSVEVSNGDRFLVVRMLGGAVAYADLRQPQSEDSSAHTHTLKRVLLIPSGAEFVNLRTVDRRAAEGFFSGSVDNGLLLAVIDGRLSAFDLLRGGVPLFEQTAMGEAVVDHLFPAASASSKDASSKEAPDVQLLDLAFHPRWDLIALGYVGEEFRVTQVRTAQFARATPLSNFLLGISTPDFARNASGTPSGGIDYRGGHAGGQQSPFGTSEISLGLVVGPLRWARPSIQFVDDAVVVSDGTTSAILTPERSAPISLLKPALVLSEVVAGLSGGETLIDDATLAFELVGSRFIGVRTINWSATLIVVEALATRKQGLIGLSVASADGGAIAFAATAARPRSRAFRVRPAELEGPSKLFIASIDGIRTEGFVENATRVLGERGRLSDRDRLRYGVGAAIDRTLIEGSQRSRAALAAPGFLTSSFVGACEAASEAVRLYWFEDQCLSPFRWVVKWRGVEKDLDALMEEDRQK